MDISLNYILSCYIILRLLHLKLCSEEQSGYVIWFSNHSNQSLLFCCLNVKFFAILMFGEVL